MKFRSCATALLLFSASACGPINQRPDIADPTTAPTLSAGSTVLSKDNRFYVYVAGASTNSSGALSSPAELGENLYTVRFVRTDDLLSPGTDAKVTVSYEMPSMPEMGVSTEPGVRQPDGSFVLNLFYSMQGKWQVTIRLEDGEIADEHTFQVLL